MSDEERGPERREENRLFEYLFEAIDLSERKAPDEKQVSEKHQPGECEESPFFVKTDIPRIRTDTSVERDGFDRWGFRISAATVLLLFVTAGFTYRQWIEARRTADAAVCALKQSQNQFEDTLTQMQLQTQAQEDSVKKEEIAALATQRAAKVSEDALHISERAYISTGVPYISWPNQDIQIPIDNKGHIQSGNVKIRVYESTDFPNPPMRFADYCWHESVIDTLPSGESPISISVGKRYFDSERIKKGLQSFHFGVEIIYNDGFPKTPERVWRSCIASNWQNGSVTFNTCLGNQLELIKKSSGFPDGTHECDVLPNPHAR